MALGAGSKPVPVILLGVGGAGKSSTGNTLLRQDVFSENRGFHSAYSRCQSAKTKVDGLRLQVWDTPGLDDLDSRPEEEALKDIKEVLTADGSSPSPSPSPPSPSPSPQVVLMVIRMERRFTQEYYEAFCKVKSTCGAKVLKHMIVVFAGIYGYGDTLEDQRAVLVEYLASAPHYMKQVLAEADYRFIGINNRDSRKKRDLQASEIVAMIKDQLISRPIEAEAESQAVRVVLVGERRVGKSALGNTLLRRPVFNVVRNPFDFEESKSQYAEARVEDVILKVTETSDLEDSSRLKKEVKGIMKEGGPEPPVFLMLIGCHRGFAKDGYKMYSDLKKMFGETFTKRVIIVFVGIDQLGETLALQRAYLTQHLAYASRYLKKVVTEAEDRIIGINNRATKKERAQQASELLAIVKDQLTNNRPTTAEAESRVLRIVLIGETGAGKSTLGNTLLHRTMFAGSHSANSVTQKCQWAEAQLDGIILQVTDTPGLSDPDRSEKDVLKEVGKSIAVASPGPHVFLMVRRIGRCYRGENENYWTLKDLFGPGINKHLIIVFTRIDEYGDTVEEQKAGLSEYVSSAKGSVKEVLDDAGNRTFGINNRASDEVKHQEVLHLIAMMKKLIGDRNDKYYRSDLSDEVQTLKEPYVQSRMSKSKRSRAKATSEVNKAIVNETECEEFFDKLQQLMKTHVLPALKEGMKKLVPAVGGAAASAAIGAFCALM